MTLLLGLSTNPAGCSQPRRLAEGQHHPPPGPSHERIIARSHLNFFDQVVEGSKSLICSHSAGEPLPRMLRSQSRVAEIAGRLPDQVRDFERHAGFRGQSSRPDGDTGSLFFA
ncbi:hypothetical protein POX_a01889 [Penicillium oxalicum]|uniref:Uncharacterized protein n=1 Tax=Penicillium oxalicum (strain 114-2 / CGMCC 5302) TaxID=933388 RepID=S7ZRN9_PENO1|nr:hypothetical protein POX_a01889 [Penicillium oxalicum]EPS33114.1 hypothetical protein PDE_08076 [Penicillium oxalicum 114-2]KAI2795284.1 hypothetical protein POX_a01889 [Penicillium oxalicum]